MPASSTATNAALQRAINDGRIALTETAAQFFSTPFADKTSVILHRRSLKGNFNALATYFKRRQPKAHENYSIIQETDLQRAAGRLSGAAQDAAREILADISLLRQKGFTRTELRLIHEQNYNKDKDDYNLISNVHLFHTDGGDAVMGRALVPYNEPTTEGIDPAECVRFVDIPAYRRQLLELKGITTPNEHQLRALDYSYSAGYHVMKPGAVPYAFRAGDMFRHACVKNKAGVPPHLHRAPPPSARTRIPRLLLVGDVS